MLPIGEFYKHQMMGDGHLGKCKECTKKDVRENYVKRRVQYSEYERERFKTPERKASLVKAQAKRRTSKPEKYSAHNKVSNAIRDGKLIKGVCEVCGDPDVQGHHDDYSRPLSVRWMCFKHHREIGHGQVVISDWKPERGR